MGYKLFNFNKGVIEIDKIEILTVPEFKEILRRDKGSEGDSDGRKKYKAFKEFAYIYHMGDPRSKPNVDGFNDIQAHDYSIMMAGLDSKYKPDNIVISAVRIYEEANSDPATESIQELLKTYAFVKTIFKKVRRSIEDIVKNDKLSKEQAAEVLGLINTLIQQGREIPELTRDLRKAIKELESADTNDNLEVMRGNKLRVPSSADPDRDYTGK